MVRRGLECEDAGSRVNVEQRLIGTADEGVGQRLRRGFGVGRSDGRHGGGIFRDVDVRAVAAAVRGDRRRRIPRSGIERPGDRKDRRRRSLGRADANDVGVVVGNRPAVVGIARGPGVEGGFESGERVAAGDRDIGDGTVDGRRGFGVVELETVGQRVMGG